MSRQQERVVDVVIPVGPGSIFPGMVAVFALVIGAGIAVMVLVTLLFPTPDYPSVEVTRGATTTSQVGGAR
ncbi:hypothetical protein ACFYTF_28900 [Nocardia thailandica]|uniref:Uncharacterized protein n=1 Tax=Nocardia thailandica TaxID=257275 RepID=A0ABW6PWP6_9NOCA